MAVYCVTYDLVGDRDYDALYKKIRKYGTYAHVLESSWLLISSQSASEIRDEISEAIDEDDKLFVAEVRGDWATRKIGKEITDWMKQNM